MDNQEITLLKREFQFIEYLLGLNLTLSIFTVGLVLKVLLHA